MSAEYDDEPVKQTLKVVQVMRCAPGFTHKADNEPIAIVTLAHDGEVEQPMMLRPPEAEKLQFGLLAALAYHGDTRAKEIIARFYKPRSDGKD